MKFLLNKPIALVNRSLVISDLHIGIEQELRKSGIFIQPQIDKLLGLIEEAVEETRAKRLIILGDLKHEVPGLSLRELREVPRFLARLAEKIEVIITKGNHDANLERMPLPDVKIYGSGGFKLGKYGFFHGHGWPAKELIGCDYLFMGHLQPAIEFRDSMGYRLIEQVWVRTRVNRKVILKRYGDRVGKLILTVVPSFNKLAGSFSLNSERKLLGPLLNSKAIEKRKFKIYLMDGTYLGTLERIAKT